MRGVYCIYGATLLSVMAAILLVFVNISQLNPGAVTNGLYFVQMDVSGLAKPYDLAGGSAGVYVGDGTLPLGNDTGLRQQYRYGIYNGCGYAGYSGSCNSSIFGYPFDPLGSMLADIPQANGKKDLLRDLLQDRGLPIFDTNYNSIISRIGGLLIFVGSALCGINIIVGFFKSKPTLLAAAVLCGLSAFLLLIGASMWSAVIAKNATINGRMWNPDTPLGITFTTGSSLYVTWAAFVFQVLATVPYVITGLTYSRKAFEYD